MVAMCDGHVVSGELRITCYFLWYDYLVPQSCKTQI